jgi:hypothetical protein
MFGGCTLSCGNHERNVHNLARNRLERSRTQSRDRVPRVGPENFLSKVAEPSEIEPRRGRD